MDYLFFDIECANCYDNKGKICEFGYILTDEQFNIKEHKIITINPRAQFHWYVIKNLLAYTQQDYLNSPDYRDVYGEIARLFTSENTLFFGHTVATDVKYINDEAKRYNLPFFSYDFYDVKQMYLKYNSEAKICSVKAICDEFELLEVGHIHRSEDDAYATMLIVKELCKRQNTDVNGLICACPPCRGSTKNGTIITAQQGNKKEKTKKSKRREQKPKSA